MGRVRNSLTVSPLIKGRKCRHALAFGCCATLTSFVARPADVPTPTAERLSAKADFRGRMVARQDGVIGGRMHSFPA
jgi:hypothetical protein